MVAALDQLSSSAVESGYGVAVASMALDQERTEGEATVRLIESSLRATADPGAGSLVDFFA